MLGRRVKSGQEWRPPAAAAWNTILDSAEDYQRRTTGTNGQAPNGRLGPGEVWVYNSGDADQDRFAVMALFISAASIADTTKDAFFDSSPALYVTNINGRAAGHIQSAPIAILQEPIAIGKMGVAKISGLAQVLVNMSDGAHYYAEIEPGNTDRLRSAPMGSARIVHRAGNSGDQWCLVEINSHAAGNSARIATAAHANSCARVSVAGDVANATRMAVTATVLRGIDVFSAGIYRQYDWPLETVPVVCPTTGSYAVAHDDPSRELVAAVPNSTLGPLPVAWSAAIVRWVGMWTSPMHGDDGDVNLAYVRDGASATLQQASFTAGATASGTAYLGVESATGNVVLQDGSTGLSWFVRAGTYATDGDGFFSSLVCDHTTPIIVPRGGYTGDREVREDDGGGGETTKTYTYVNGQLTSIA